MATQDQYAQALEEAGFNITRMHNRCDFATEFFAETRRQMKQAEGAPPLGVHIAMGDSAPIKIGNMVENIASGSVSPVEIFAAR